MAPPHATPPPPVPDHWLGYVAADASGANAAELSWQAYFRDPVLQRLIETALVNNRDLRVAALRAEEARAAFRIQRADQFPGFGIDAQSARARVPGDLSATGQSVVAGEYRAEVGLSSWELDLWGRVRSLKASALQRWLATEAGARAVELALIGQVADGYLGLRELDERVMLARRTVEAHEESYRIFGRRHDVGATSRLELTQVQTLLTQAQALLAQLELARANQLHALGQLLGAHPGPLPEAAPFDETLVLAELAPGLPSDLLASRPDIAAAEHTLHAANARVQAARAAFFPRIALTTSAGTASAHLDGLFDSGSRAWTFAPSISVPLFDGGRLQSNLDLSAARQNIAVADYEKTVQTAFREVSDALATRATAARQITLQQAQRDALHERARLAQLRYDHGATPYFEVLDAQRDLLAAEQQLVQARYALQAAHIAVYAALGGGAPAR